MKILIDALIVKPGQGGIRSVAVNLARSLATIPGVTPIVLSTDEDEGTWSAFKVVSAKVGSNSPLSRYRWRRLHRDRLVRDLAVDVVLTVSPEYVPAKAALNFIMVHDIGPLVAPGLYGPLRFLRYAMTLRHGVRSADGVICVSAATRLDVVRWCGLKEAAKIFVVRNAAKPLASGNKGSARKRLLGSYALYVGAYLPHKNLDPVLRAFSQRTAGLPSHLVCVGPDYLGERRSMLGRYLGSDWLISLGFVDDAELRDLYEDAAVVVMPSLFEGFGMPIVEALSHGTPVIATRLPVFQEIAKGGVIYVDDPLSVEDWHSALMSVGTAEPLKPMNINAEYTWDTAAAEVVAVIEEVGRRGE